LITPAQIDQRQKGLKKQIQPAKFIAWLCFTVDGGNVLRTHFSLEKWAEVGVYQA
jgi:hypothetical protein